jgi:uncharacterized protein with ParB-like and HNH nuclease domain
MSISLKDFDKKYKHICNKGLSFYHIGTLRSFVSFDFDVFLPSKNLNLQRDLVWTKEQKQSLILTLLKDQKINPFVVVQKDVNKTKENKYEWEVIDGKQRLTTIFDFLDNKFFIDLKSEEYFFKDLPEDCQKRIYNYSLYTVDVHYNYDNKITDEVKIDLFEDINWLGTPQDIQHLKKLKNE